MKPGALTPLVQLRTEALQGDVTQKPYPLWGNAISKLALYKPQLESKWLLVSFLVPSSWAPWGGNMFPPRQEWPAAKLPPPTLDCCAVGIWGKPYVCNPLFLPQAIPWLLPSEEQDRAGLAHRDFPSLQLSCFSAQRVSQDCQADLAGFCVARGACCKPLGVLLSRPSGSRCHPWERSECQLSPGLQEGLSLWPWEKHCWESVGRSHSLLCLSSRPGQLCLSPCRLVYPWGTTWTDGRGPKFNREGQG